MAKKTATSEADVTANTSTSPKVDVAGAGEYTVVARRYRPQQFSELIGQEAVGQAIHHAIQSGRVAHAYLFTGARGVGKTSAARILAKALNCVNGPTATPCGVCESCVGIAASDDIDVIEIDGASNTGVDDARIIRQNVATRPVRSRYKIYIIDEVHMLTKQAFNALLKTLEEPPPHVKFIFATTEPEKVLITIRSRCQRFDFPSISTAKIADHLKHVLASENRIAEDEAIRLVARRAAGSMRDAQSLLEQLISSATGPLTVDHVNEVLGTGGVERIIKLAGAILDRDPTTALTIVAQCADEGLQLNELIDQLIEYWRALMLLSCSNGKFADLDYPESHHPVIRQEAAQHTLDTILAGLDVLTTTKSRLKTTSHEQVLLEMAVVRMARMDELISLTQLAQWISQGGAGKLAIPASSGGSPVVNTDPSKKNGQISLSERFASKIAAPEPVANQPTTQPLTDATLSDIWTKVRSSVGAMLSAELDKAGLPAILGPKSLALRFPARYNHAYEYCKDAPQISLIEGHLKRLTGVPWSVRFEIDSQTTERVSVSSGLSAKDREKLALQSPLLTAVVNKLEGRLLKMEDGFGNFGNADDTEPEDSLPADDLP